MTAVRVKFDNGDTITTRINGSKKEITDYYFNNLFQTKSYNEDIEEEPLAVGISVEFLEG